MNAWIDFQRDREAGGAIAPKSLVAYEGRVARILGTGIGQVLAEQLTRADCEDAYNALRKTDSASTSWTDMHTLRSAIRWGAKRGYCPDVDMKGIAKKPRQRDRVYNSRIPTPGEVARVLAAIDDERYRDALAIQACIGCRIGEVMALRMRDVDPAGMLSVSGLDEDRDRVGKTGTREVPIIGDALEVVLRRYDPDEPDAYLIPLPASAATGASQWLSAACEAAKVEPFTTHGLRYMAANAMLDARVDPELVSKITGHSLLTLLRTYRKPTDEAKRDALVRAGLGRLTPGGKVVSLDAIRAQKSGTGRHDPGGER